MMKRTKGIIIGFAIVILVAIVFGTPVFAQNIRKMIEVQYRDIAIYVDGRLVIPKDAAGSIVEPFIYEGTTYLPVRAVSEALGKTVEWDGPTNSVHIGGAMASEHMSAIIRYILGFDDIERDYIALLLQGISAGEITLTADYDDYKNGVYLNLCECCLFDIDQDGFPELILRTGQAEADFWYTVFTIIDGELIDCGGVSGSHASLYSNGSGKFVRYGGHMGSYEITISSLVGTTLITQDIAKGIVDFDKGEEYPELRDIGYGDYNQSLEFTAIPTLMLAPAG